MAEHLDYPTHIVDMHTHMFNAYYLPLKGIFISWGIPNKLSHQLARLSYSITRMSSFPHLERARIFKNDAELAVFSRKDHNDPELVSKYAEALAHDAITLFRETMPAQSSTEMSRKSGDIDERAALHAELRELFEEIQDEHGDEDSQKILEMSQTQPRLLSDHNTKSDKSILWRGAWRAVKRLIMRAMDWVESAGDAIDFLYNLTKNEGRLFRRLDRYYRKRNVTCVMVHHMMDMKWAYDDGYVRLEHYPTELSVNSQLSQMRGLQNSTGGRLLGFAGFDPHRFVKSESSEEQIVEHIEQALSYGMIGFKFYPPLDYRPAQNADERYEIVVDIFLDYCTNNNIPVFTHCTPVGFERAKGTGLNAHPKFWRAALEKKSPDVKSDRSKLRLCFGHAGGGIFDLGLRTSYGWISEDDSKWTDDINYAWHVTELCREYENVYCEIAHIIELLENNNYRKEFEARLAKELSVPATPATPHSFIDKVMFGTDWHMKEMVNDVDAYFDYIVSIFNKDSFRPYADRFFFQNAEAYLQLDIFGPIERGDMA